MREAGRYVLHERVRVCRIALADEPANNELGIGIQGDPCVHVATAKLAANIRWGVGFLRADKRPDFVALDALGLDADERF